MLTLVINLDRFPNYGEFLERGHGESISLNNFKQVAKFPQKFPAIKNGKIYHTKSVIWPDNAVNKFKNDNNSVFSTLYDCDGKYDYLKPRDIITIDKIKESNGEPIFIQITHKEKLSKKKYIELNNGHHMLETELTCK